MQGQAQLRLKYASALSLGLACAGCLVTNDLDFTQNRNPPTVRRIAPPDVSYAPSQGDPTCALSNAPESARFEADFFDDDVDQSLWVLPVVNGAVLPGILPVLEAPPNPDGSSALHQAPLICVPLMSLTQPCNIVRVLVSDDVNKYRTAPPDQLLGEADVDSIAWYLGPSAKDTPAGPAKPNISFSDCLPPLDGGM